MTDHPDADAEPLEERADPDLLARWIGVSSLLSTARDQLARRAGAWPRLALVSADTAAEAILGLIASSGQKALADRAGFEDVLAAAEEVIPLKPALRARIRAAHRLRNSALHHGAEPASAAVRRAIDAASELRTVATSSSPLLEAFRTSGPVGAVAGLLADHLDIAARLQAAEAALGAGEWTVALDQAAIALESSIGRMRPALRDRWPFHRNLDRHTRRLGADREIEERVRELSRNAEEALRQVDKRFEHIEAWLLAFGLGLQPVELARLRRTLGRVSWHFAPDEPSIHRDKAVVVTAVVAEGAVLEVADVVFRMWAGGSLRPTADPFSDELAD